ncbi:MAG: glycosyltransferase family 1 protein [Candidatus Aenigmarchaeota archaeon]|nr:glycosyltransferase family 4 protein [Candidatus Aenigmarchaeota archaeon]MDW8160399.1 glycosyltransferase family 1 protein [Candidatus Aenigmarchaeota archaeon]
MEVYHWNSSRINEISGIRKYEDNLFEKLLEVAEKKSIELKIHRILRGTKRVLDSVVFSWLIKYKGKSNVHGTSQVLAPAIYLKKPRNHVITVHDLAPLLYPFEIRDISEKIQWKIVPRALKRIEHLIAISKFTKNEIVRLLNVREENISIIYQGVDHQLYKPLSKESCRKFFGLSMDRKYILYVASNLYHKRIDLAKKIFEEIKKYRDDVEMIKAGYSEKLEGEGIISMEWIKEEDMPKLYNSADVYLHTSEYEGFGLPILEAMACGIPVVASNRASIPEVVGNAGILVDLDSNAIKNFAEALLKVLEKEEKICKKSLERSKIFTWEKTAEETLKLYEAVFRKD